MGNNVQIILSCFFLNLYAPEHRSSLVSGKLVLMLKHRVVNFLPVCSKDFSYKKWIPVTLEGLPLKDGEYLPA